MSNLSIASMPTLSAEVERALNEMAENRILSPARRAGHELTFAGITGLPKQESIYRNEWGTWQFVDHLKDPSAQQYATLLRRRPRIPIPSDQLARLRELDRCGVSPQLAWIVHQLPDDYQDGDPLPKLVPPPRELREKDARLVLQLATATRLFARGVATVLAGAAAAPVVAASAAAGAMIGIGADPLIFGGVKHPDLPAVAWCLLAQWEWE